MVNPRLRQTSSQDTLVPPPSPATISEDKSFTYSSSYLNFKSCEHSNAVLAMFDNMRQAQELCDVVLVVEKKEFHCHKSLLSANSPYFKAMFTGVMTERYQSRVVLHDINSVAMDQIIGFFYTSSLTLSMDNVGYILPAASMFHIDNVVKACCEFMRRNIGVSNCLGISAYADTHSCLELKALADDYAMQHFPEVIQAEEFLQLPFGQLEQLISSDNLNVHSEERVYEAVMAWVKYEPDLRSQYIARLLDNVSLLSTNIIHCCQTLTISLGWV